MLNVFTKLLSPKKDTTCGDCAKRERYTLLNAAADTIRGDFATPEVKAARLETCSACDYLAKGSAKTVTRADRCKLCGCFVHLKASYAQASCDINKW